MNFWEIMLYPIMVVIFLAMTFYFEARKKEESINKLAKIRVKVSDYRRQNLPVEEEETPNFDIPDWFYGLLIILTSLFVGGILISIA